MSYQDADGSSGPEDTDKSDADIVREMAAGPDPDALEVLYDRYSVLAFSLAVRMLSDRQAAEDIVQEAFLVVWRNASRFDTARGNFRSWLVTIVRSRCIDKMRANAVRPQLAFLENALDTPDRQDVWTEVSHSLTRNQMKQALAQLPAEQKETIELAYFGGLTQSEIAKRVGIPLGTVKSRIRIGLERLKALLGGIEMDSIS